MSVSNLSWLKKKSQSVDITAPGFNPLGGAGKQAPQASKAPAPKTPIIEEEENNSANTQKHPPRKSELKRFYTIALCRLCSRSTSLGSALSVPSTVGAFAITQAINFGLKGPFILFCILAALIDPTGIPKAEIPRFIVVLLR